MTNNPNPQQNKPSSSSTSFGQQGSSGRTEGNAGSRQDMGRSQGSETQQFGGIRGGVESEKSSSRSSSPDVERYLGAIEENCRKLRDALGASATSSMSRSESSESSRSGSSIGSNPSSGNQAGRASR